MSNIPQTGLQQDRAREAEAREQEKQRKQQEQERQSEQSPKPRGPLQTSRGVTTLDDVVVAKIAGMAAREVPGVYDMGNAVRRAFSAVTDRIPNAQTNVAGGISVEKGETQAAVDVTVVTEYGASIVEVGNAIRRNIIDQVENTTGLEVIEVNVNVADVHLPSEDNNNGSSSGSQSSRSNELK
ncbi:Asp23/Gls24 family envelope stress response protein [Enemella evansiae]|uniref:Asp23/Gls24 family envelope stress response protein n=1 Tax=Enemella evansiae TaxID=2016499 RepID=A0A255GT55_9ACTN|nr:Asp23/Gls24 family envelope stress response protein [Enemella evansiae]PFG68950.1 putative alkaline shock family protein YloU [Propionibacteriaceae bacterium ES.041]OYN96940.1 Asp23/Gls24 family envelope stress response protein [Enemella evansiae]OYO06218.1 Asp23/Gls24 family envelope stress response protein [Enemella evansiae]OYO11906.1 Asp23/Gls24 family envelope stress response protein [Enemella evansiae]OYO17643.1 Asp23/Gls24 family envelope stress response protein [Enemella evansiae]